ncbi:hypothetical protein GW796_08020 [archaeon]|nr:hypothetical protein [archaeon]
MLGFKIFDRDDDELLNNLFLLAQKDNLSLEIALYDNNIVDFTKRMLNNSLYLSNPNKSIHLHYNKYVVNNIHDEKHYNNMLLELSQAKALQLNRGVIHYQYPPNYQIHLENLTPESLKKNLSLLNKIAISHASPSEILLKNLTNFH